MSSPAPSTLAELRERLAERIASGELDVPMLPRTASEVLALCEDPGSDALALAQLIQRDQSLAAHTLKVANSAAHAPLEPIVSLHQAVSRLGSKTMRDIALAVAMKGKVFVLRGQEQRVRALWAHSATAAAWAKEIARARRSNVEGAFLCGLLHDIGRPVLLQAVLELARAGGTRPDDAALDGLMREFHCEVGAQVLERWKLPGWMVAAARFHHDADAAGDEVELARTTQLADLLAHSSEHPDPAADEVLRTHPVLSDLGLYADEAEVLFARRAQVQAVAASFA